MSKQPACHRCMNTTVNGTAKSRTDNTTLLCTDCEVAEAIEDYQGILMPKEDWVWTRMCRTFGLASEFPPREQEQKQ
jgi:hypothetical protein